MKTFYTSDRNEWRNRKILFVEFNPNVEFYFTKEFFELPRKSVFAPRGSRCNETTDGCLATSTLKRSQNPFFAPFQ